MEINNVNKANIDIEKIAFVLIDVQEKLLPLMKCQDKIVSNINVLIQASSLLEIPLIVTEQYPQGLGKTSNKIKIPQSIYFVEKNSFSCFGSEVFNHFIKKKDIKYLIIFGVESHICVLQTVVDAIDENLFVYVIADAISSRTKKNNKIGISFMHNYGAFVSSTESILFQVLKTSKHPSFKAISKLIK